jgi:hypothetical protein
MANKEGAQLDTLPSQMYGKNGSSVVALKVSSDGSMFQGMDIPEHDYIALSYTGDDLTGIVYKTGGSGGTTVATLTLSYTDSVLQSVTKT